VNGGSFTYTLNCANTTGTETLTWTPPASNTDGSAISPTPPGALAGYKIYVGRTESAVQSATPILVNDPAVQSYTLQNLPVGLTYYAIRAFNTEGIESDLSVDSATGKFLNSTVVSPSASGSASIVVNVRPRPPVMVVKSTAVYELRTIGDDVRLGRLVGRIAKGVECGSEVVFYRSNGSGYYEVPQDAVLFKKTPKSSIVVSRCVES
jgi:hypothetical protein